MKSRRQSMLLLLAGATLMLFSNGRWTTILAGWIYPVFFLRFMDIKKPPQGFLMLCLVTGVANYLMWWRMIPVPGSLYFLITCVGLQVMNLSYVASRLIGARWTGFSSTLIYPLSYCSLEYLLATGTSKGTWLMLGYSQARNLPLMQLVSLTGIWGISFLMSWFSSILHWIWKNDFSWKNTRKGILAFGTILLGVFLFGLIRLFVFDTGSIRLLTASIVQQRGLNNSISSCRWTDARAVGLYSDELEQNLLDNSKKAAKAGAKIVLWQEGAGFIPKSRESMLIEKARSLAANEKIYLLMTLWSIPENFPVRLVENKLIVIDSVGQVQTNYIKNFPAPPEPIIKGDGRMPVVHTSFGVIAPAICADADYPGFIRQSSRKKVDLMFIPANDWLAIDPLHSYMAMTRAIENGFTLVRAAGQGLSTATDNRGRMLAFMDYYKTNDQIMYAEVPIQRTWTFYGWAGDYFPIGGLIILAAMLLQRLLRRKKGEGPVIATENKWSPTVS